MFIHSPALLEKKGRINPSTSFVPNGVNYSLHSERCPEPSDLTRIPRPRIGYTGWLKSQLNWPALIELAKRHRSWSFVFVGGLRSGHDVEHHLRELSDLPNAHFLGSKKTDEIAAYPQHFDACIMPYREDGYTKFIYPLKLHEYLASGKPTVGTRIPSLVEFSDVVHLCHGVEEWSAKLTEALSPASNTPEQCQLRQDVARSHDWHDITEQIARTMASKLGTEYAQRLDELTDEAARQAGTSSGQRSKICSAGTRSLAETHDTAKTD